MVEEIFHAKPIFKIPPQQLLAGRLNELRREHRKIRVEQKKKDNLKAQEEVKRKLIEMGREDLTQ